MRQVRVELRGFRPDKENLSVPLILSQTPAESHLRDSNPPRPPGGRGLTGALGNESHV